MIYLKKNHEMCLESENFGSRRKKFITIKNTKKIFNCAKKNINFIETAINYKGRK